MSEGDDSLYEIRLIGRDVIPDGPKAADRESISHICLRERLWIPGQTFGLPGMTAVAKGSTEYA